MSQKRAVLILESFKSRVRHLKRETYALYLAARHPHTPWYAKLFVAGVAAYAFSPIDLIPDFVPVLGHLDDLILIPLAIVVAIKLVPPEVMAECRARTEEAPAKGKPVSRVAPAVIIGIWVLLTALCVFGRTRHCDEPLSRRVATPVTSNNGLQATHQKRRA